MRNVTRFNRAILAKPEGALHDWEIFVGLAKAFAQKTGKRTEADNAAGADGRHRGLRAGLYGDASPFKLSLATLARVIRTALTLAR